MNQYPCNDGLRAKKLHKAQVHLEMVFIVPGGIIWNILKRKYF